MDNMINYYLEKEDMKRKKMSARTTLIIVALIFSFTVAFFGVLAITTKEKNFMFDVFAVVFGTGLSGFFTVRILMDSRERHGGKQCQ